jgi:hypothetical protein
MIRLNIYVIYSEELENRHGTINSSINLIKNICEEKKMEVKINIISEPSKEYVNNHISSFNSRVNYEKFKEDTIYNDLITPLNVNQISNFEKHRYIYKYILDNFQSSDVNDLHLIMEDDIIILNDYINNIKELIDVLKKIDSNINDENNWDILFTCIASINNQSIELIDSRTQYKFLLSKSSYFIKPKIATKLFEYLQIYKPNLKILTISTVEQDKIDVLDPENFNKADYILVVPEKMTKTY